MKFPDSLKQLVDRDQRIAAVVGHFVVQIEPWLKIAQMPFFPEYTDHRITHIEEVLQTAIDLATPEASNILTASDAAVLTIGVLLHDCAMHLTEDGFYTLISADDHIAPVTEFGSLPWDQLWQDFLAEARRFDGRKLTQLFGDSEPIRVPPADKNNLTKRDRLLIGEFIRRHHARLAHEIALYGIPGVDGSRVKLFADANEPSNWMSDLGGLVARSHGIQLRTAAEYVKSKYHPRDFQGVHAVFLMVLVRIADYLQIQAQRADKRSLEVRRLVSPISQAEWKVHACVRNITSAGDDPEAVFVDARPEEAVVFLRVQEWLSGIQDELDASWAVLGEVYGRFQQERLNSLKLKLRRLRSNLDDVDAFAGTVSYVPARAAFEAANPDLLKLLVGPLYGDDAGVGLRELLQNSVDAVLELEDLSRTRSNGTDELDQIPQETDIEVCIDCDKEGQPKTIVVSDRGVGMTLEVVQNYFLKAGASFRKSDAWRKQFEDDSGKSRVLRSGRFGIGVLAAFLLGDRIEVTTRHVSSPKNRALTFTADLNSTSLSLLWTSAPIGTRIQITVPEQMRKHLRSSLSIYMIESRKDTKVSFGDPLGQFFCKHPTIERTVNFTSTKRTLSVRRYLRDEVSSGEVPWRSFLAPKYAKIFWTHNDGYPFLSCNGIEITGGRSAYPGRRELTTNDQLRTPNLVVYDRDGVLPLNLQRTALANDDTGFNAQLTQSVTDDMIAFALERGPTDALSSIETLNWFVSGYRGFRRTYNQRIQVYSRWFANEKGFGFLDPHLILANKPSCILSAYGTRFGSSTNISEQKMFADRLRVDANFIFGYGFSGGYLNSRKFLFRSMLEFPSGHYYTPFFDPIRAIEPLGRRIFFRRELWDEFAKERSLGQYLRYLVDNAHKEAETENWYVVKVGTCPDQPLVKLSANENEGAVPEGTWCLAETYPNYKQQIKESTISKRWMELLGTPTIPWAKEERLKSFPAAFVALSAYVELHRQEAAALLQKADSDSSDVEAEESEVEDV